jgi:hypothetical protein
MPHPCEMLHLQLVNEKLAEIEIRAKLKHAEAKKRQLAQAA